MSALTINGSALGPDFSHVDAEGYESTFLRRGVDIQATGNYATPTIFSLQPATGTRLLLARLIIKIGDNGTVDAGSYGNGISLTNGIIVRLQNDSGTISDLTDGDPVFTNGDWATFSYDVQNTEFGAGLNYVNCRWTLQRAGALVELDGNKNERIEVVLEDNFTGLESHTFVAQGITC